MQLPRNALRSTFAVLTPALMAPLALAASAWPQMLDTLLRSGGVATLWLAACGGTGFACTAWVTRSLNGLLRAGISVAVGFGLMAIVLLLLGLGGWLALPGTAAVLLVLGLVGGGVTLRHEFRGATTADGPPMKLLELALMIALGGMVGVMLFGCCVMPGMLWKPLDPHPYDVLSYHLQVPREWYEAGRIVPLKHNVFSFMPMSAEVHGLGLMHLMGGPWRAMYAVQFLSAGWIIATLLAVGGVVKHLWPTAPRTSVLSAMLATLVPWSLMLGSVAYNEPAVMLMSVLAAGLLLRPIGLKHVALAGVLLGFAAGVKYTSLLLPGAAVAFVGLALAWRTPNVLLVRAGVLIACGVIAVSPWLVRNAAWAGNPVFPLAMNTLGRAHFDESQVERFDTAHSPRADQRSIAARTAAVGREMIVHRQYDWLLWPTAVAGAVVAWSLRQREPAWLLAMIALMAVGWAIATHLQSRFLTPAVPLAAVAIGLGLRPTWLAATSAGAIAVLSAAFVVPLLLEQTGGERAILIGVPSPAGLLDERFDATAEQGERVILAGDAQAFLYTLPMRQLAYRTVFDVPAGNGDAIERWTAGLAPADDAAYLIAVDQPELKRMAETYAGLEMPADHLPRFIEHRGR